MVPVTAFFAGVFAFIFIGLSFLVILGRYKHKVSLGDGGHAVMTRRIRAHANFAEYVPFTLILMGLCEINKSSHMFLYILGIALIIGRLSHIYSLLVVEARPAGSIIFRQFGMVTTLTVIVIFALSMVF